MDASVNFMSKKTIHKYFNLLGKFQLLFFPPDIQENYSSKDETLGKAS